MFLEDVRVARTTWVLVAHLAALLPTDSSSMLALRPAFLFSFFFLEGVFHRRSENFMYLIDKYTEPRTTIIFCC
jgi:hypothetical protein